MKQFSIFTVVAFLFIPVLGQAAEPPCPEMFLTRMKYANMHLQSAARGVSDVLVADYEWVMNEIKMNPNVVNCVDDLGQRPLTTVFDWRMNLCALPEMAQVLLDHGARIQVTDGLLGKTPIMLAVENYGMIYGSPVPIEMKNENVCASETPAAVLKGLIQTLIQKGAKLDQKDGFGMSARRIAKTLKVDSVLSQSVD